jgi:hypothetical protein
LPLVWFGETAKMSFIQYTIKFKVDLNIDDSQRHYTSRKKLSGYSSNIKPEWAMAMKGLYKIYNVPAVNYCNTQNMK